MNKKNVLIIVGLLTVVILPMIIVIYLQQTSATHYSSKFQRLVTDNNWGKAKDFEGCKKNQQNCIIIAASLIDNGAYIKAYYSNYNLKSLQNDINKIKDLVNNKKNIQAYKQADKTIKNVNKTYDIYIKTNQENFNQVDKLLYGPDPNKPTFTNINYQIIGGWAKVTMLSNNQNTMSASVILKKTNSAWSIVWGPGTSFDNNVIKKYPDIPSEFLDGPQKNSSAIAVFNKNGKKPPESIIISDSTKTLIDPLSRYLPHYADTYAVESEIFNGLPVYTVSYYKTNGNTLEKTKSDFKSWLKEVGVEAKDSSIKYKDINEAKDSINVVD